MKNIQVIDSGSNCTYSIYQIDDQQFAVLFPSGGDIEFAEDVESRLGEAEFSTFQANLWAHPIEKINVAGIHGTLFYGLAEEKRRHYPRKRFYDDVYAFSEVERRLFNI